MIYRVILICLAIAGIVMMGYLTKLHYATVENAFCNLGEGLSCDAVNQSEYSEILGIPLSGMGMAFFAALLFIFSFKYNKDNLKKVVFVSIVFLGPSFYLTGIELFVLENLCIFCELSKVVIISTIVVAWLSMRPSKLNQQFFVGAVLLAVFSGGATAFIQSSVGGPGERYVEFAQCLDEKGFKMYGSATCVFCARQRAMFGPAFEHINEIECDPRNKNPQAELCIRKNIEHTPTWIQEDNEGNNIYKFEAGVQSFEKLAEVSGCELPK